jgi:hypothetical protein
MSHWSYKSYLLAVPGALRSHMALVYDLVLSLIPKLLTAH